MQKYNVKNDVKNFFYQPINNDTKTYKYIRKTAMGQGDDHKTGYFLSYSYFKENFKKIMI